MNRVWVDVPLIEPGPLDGYELAGSSSADETDRLLCRMLFDDLCRYHARALCRPRSLTRGSAREVVMGRGDLADFGHGFLAVSGQFLVAYRATTTSNDASRVVKGSFSVSFGWSSTGVAARQGWATSGRLLAGRLAPVDEI